VLLVDDDESEVVKHSHCPDQRVGSHDEMNVAGRQRARGDRAGVTR
jgi:hypothetical protein